MKLVLLLGFLMPLTFACSAGTERAGISLKKDLIQETDDDASDGDESKEPRQSGRDTSPLQSQEDLPDEEAVTPPKQIAGAYMTATVLPRNAGENVIRVGIVGKLDDVRLSDEPETYKSTWTLGFAEPLPVIVTLSKSTDRNYDQQLEFFGSQEQFEEFASQINISLQFQQNLDGSIVSSVVDNTLFEILPTE